MVVGCERDEGADGPANCPRPTFENGARVLFLFLYFSISFFTKIYFCFRNLQKYIPAAPLPGGRHLAARLQGDRLSHPYIRVGRSPHPSLASLKFQKPRKKREGGREIGEALPDFRAGDCR